MPMPWSNAQAKSLQATGLMKRTVERYPDWWPCLNVTGSCPHTKGPCGPKKTVEKDVIVDLMSASFHGNALWVWEILQYADSLLLQPQNRTITNVEDMVVYLTGYNRDGTRTGRYFIPPGYIISAQLQRDNIVSVVANASVPSLFLPGNTTALHKWDGEFDDCHKLKNLRIYIDTLFYPDLQNLPSLTEYAILNFTKPPSRPYDNCIGDDNKCRGYDKPCKYDVKSLLTQETLYLAQNITVQPYYDQVFSFFSDDGTSFAPYVSSFLGPGNAILATYYQLLDPTFGDPSYLYPSMDRDYRIMEEGSTTIVSGTFVVHFILTGKITRMTLWWQQDFDAKHRLLIYTVIPDALMVIENLSGTISADPDFYCNGMAINCVGADNQFPVQSGPRIGLTCREFANATIAGRPQYCNPLGIATVTGNCLACNAFHQSIAQAGGPGSIEAHVHCPHAGGARMQSNGVLNPCFDA